MAAIVALESSIDDATATLFDRLIVLGTQNHATSRRFCHQLTSSLKLGLVHIQGRS